MPISIPAGQSSIDQAAKLQFEQTFYHLQQESDFRLRSTGAIRWLPAEGKYHNLARMGSVELNEVSTRNPLKQFDDYSVDNRRFRKRRFTKTILIDELDDINELIKDPTADIYTNLVAAVNRVAEKIAITSAIGDVLIGQPDAAPIALSAADDGVITIDASGGITYGTITQATENFINNKMDMSQALRSVLCVSGKENTALMNEEKFINNRYIAPSVMPVDQGIQTRVSAYPVVLFAGSVNGGIQVTNPLLPETSAGLRRCVMMAPEAIVMSMKINKLEIGDSDQHVASKALTVDLWVNAMRTEGAKVQIINTTI